MNQTGETIRWYREGAVNKVHGDPDFEVDLGHMYVDNDELTKLIFSYPVYHWYTVLTQWALRRKKVVCCGDFIWQVLNRCVGLDIPYSYKPTELIRNITDYESNFVRRKGPRWKDDSHHGVYEDRVQLGNDPQAA